MTPLRQGLLSHNVIDICGEIRSDMVLYVREAVQQLRANGSPQIEVHISSSGGDLEGGLDIYDMLRLYSGKKIGIVTINARSAAALILQACDIRKCARHAYILVHNATTEIKVDALFDKRRLKKYLEHVERERHSTHVLVQERCKKPLSAVRALFKKDRHLDAKEALDFGLIDEII